MKIKKVIALWLAVIMLVSLFPVAVFGRYPDPAAGDRPMQQRPVTDPGVMFRSRSGDNYSFDIVWTRPQDSTVRASTNVADTELHLFGSSFWTLFPTHYQLRFRNATSGENFNTSISDIMAESVAGQDPIRRPRGEAQTVSLNMQSNSLYEIQINPIRNIPRWGTQPTTPPTRYATSQPAPVDTSVEPRRDLLFMTDINVRAEGRGNSITITWDNPTWGGRNVFDYWQIGFQRYQPNQPVGEGRVFPVVSGAAVPGSQIQQNSDGTLSITITDRDIIPMRTFAVSVEPMLGSNIALTEHRIRTRDRALSYIPFEFNNQRFNLAFSPLSEVEYRTETMIIPELNIEQLGTDFIRLWWPHLGGFADMPISHVYIEEWPPEMEGETPTRADLPRRIGQPLGIIEGDQFLTYINEWLEGPGIPRIRRGFSLAIHFVDDNREEQRTDVVVYDPLAVDFSPYRPDIVSLSHVGNGRLSMEWLAFARHAVIDEENDLIPFRWAHLPEGNHFNNRFVDTSIVYEIFISDSWEGLNALTRPLKLRTPIQLQEGLWENPVDPAPPQQEWEPTWSLTPLDLITHYQTPTNLDGRPIQGNRVYFVKIRAVRVPGGQDSAFAFGSVYVPPLDGLPITPEMISSPPVRVDHGNITETSIPIYWDMRYLEIMQPFTSPSAIEFRNPVPERDVWHTVVGVDRRNNLIFGRSAAHINYVIGENAVDLGAEARHRILNEIIAPPSLRNELLGVGTIQLDVNSPIAVGEFLNRSRGYVNSFLSGLGFNTAANFTALRIQDMSRFSYQIHAVPIDTMMRFGGFERYREMINADISMWDSIGRPDDVNGVINYTVPGLTGNTTYVIFIRPYHMVGDRLIHARYPTFVVGTTVVEPHRPIPDPTTPVLHAVPRYTTDYQVAVRWLVQSNMIYDIRISHFFTDYENNTGTSIPISLANITAADAGALVRLEDPAAYLWIEEVNGIRYFHLRIQDRFPDTTYYIWAMAQSVDGETGNPVSDWSQQSNPVDIRTLDIEPPPPPRSLARVPQNLLNLYNRYNETTHRNDEPDTLIISFLRIFRDFRDEHGGLRPRAEAGTAEGGSVEPLNLPNVPETDAYAAIHIIRFSDLVANTEHFVRARTILTVQRGGPRIYSYEIQLADNEDFLDAVTFIIPPLIPMDPINTRRAYSEWVNIVLDTGVDDGEFDGVHRPDQFPLPEYDWDITYDPLTQTLQWRFRTNQRGSDGRLDQNVDQRFITRLLQTRAFNFIVDLSSYGDMPIANRVVILPESILRAFDSEQITFSIAAGDLNFEIPPGAFNTAQTRALRPGIGSYYRISINAVDQNLPPLVTNTQFDTVPTRINVAVVTPNRTETLNTFARPLDVVLPVGDFDTPDGLRTGLYIHDLNAAAWRDTRGEFSFLYDTLTTRTSIPATFAAITRNAPPMAEPRNPANQAMQNVSSRLTITDMFTFDPARAVTPNQFNNIVNALVRGQSTVTMNANLPAASLRSLNNARLAAPQNFTRENVIDTMVRLYMNRTQQLLQPMTPAASIPGIENATPALHRNLRIAADLGFITGPLEPDGELTFGEFMNMVDIIMIDAGIN